MQPRRRRRSAPVSASWRDRRLHRRRRRPNAASDGRRAGRGIRCPAADVILACCWRPGVTRGALVFGERRRRRSTDGADAAALARRGVVARLTTSGGRTGAPRAVDVGFIEDADGRSSAATDPGGGLGSQPRGGPAGDGRARPPDVRGRLPSGWTEPTTTASSLHSSSSTARHRRASDVGRRTASGRSTPARAPTDGDPPRNPRPHRSPGRGSLRRAHRCRALARVADRIGHPRGDGRRRLRGPGGDPSADRPVRGRPCGDDRGDGGRAEPDSRFAVTGRDQQGATTDIEARLTADDGATSLAWRVEIRLPLMLRAFESLAAPQVRHAIDLDLEAFRRRFPTVPPD